MGEVEQGEKSNFMLTDIITGCYTKELLQSFMPENLAVMLNQAML